MGTVWIREFSGGLDTRRLPETTPGGSLIRARDCHINRGGELEQRAEFVLHATLPSGTRGLAGSPSSLVVFGHQASPPAGMPSGFEYQQLAHPDGEALTDVPYWHLFKGEIQAIGEFVDDSRYLFANGTRVTDSNAPTDPTALLTTAEKLYAIAGSVLRFSAVADSTDFGDGAGVGASFKDLSTHAQKSEELVAIALYDQYVAIFAGKTVQIWVLDPDDALDNLAQVLVNTGCLAPRAVTQFGDGDLFYLARTGIRSLRARDSSNTAATTDIGSPIDTVLSEVLDSVSATVLYKAIGVIEPKDGRYWLALGDTIYVFSFFSQSKVSAWSEYKPGFSVDHMFEWNDRIWIRSGEQVYVYGGASGPYQYSDSVVAEAWMPYLDGDDPTRAKQVSGVDAAVRGTWEVRIGLDHNNENASDRLAVISKTTFNGERLDALGEATHLSPRFISRAPQSANKPAVLSSAVIHYLRTASEDA